MGKVKVSLFFCAILFCVLWPLPANANAGNIGNFDVVTGDIINNRDFFKIPSVLRGYEHCLLYRSERLNTDNMAVILLEPSGFGYSVVYNTKTMEIVYREAHIYKESEREYMRKKSVSVPFALKLANSDIPSNQTVYRNKPRQANERTGDYSKADIDEDAEKVISRGKRSPIGSLFAGIADAIDKFCLGARRNLMIFPFF